MSLGKPERIYVTYIKAAPEQVWAALTRGEFTRQYFFGRSIESDWQVNASWTLWMDDGRVDCAGKVLECDPPRRLSMTWKVEWLEDFRHLPPGVVTYELEALGAMTRLTVLETHDDALPEKFKEGGRNGWPLILCGLKSLLETGAALPPFDPMSMAPAR